MQRIKVEIDKIFAPSDAYRNNCSTPKAANQLLGLEKDLYDLFKEIFEVIFGYVPITMLILRRADS